MAGRSHYNTKQREVLLDYLRERQGTHVTAADVCAHVLQTGGSLSRSTVYRQLESLVNEGFLNKYIIDGESPACFEYVDRESHGAGETCYHCKCEQCGRLIHLHCEEMDAFGLHLRNEHGFSLDPVRTVIYGLCGACAAKRG